LLSDSEFEACHQNISCTEFRGADNFRRRTFDSEKDSHKNWLAHLLSEAQMDYRAYLVDPEEGHFVGVRVVEAPDDQTALRHAKQLVGKNHVEVWLRERMVGRLTAKHKRWKPRAPVAQTPDMAKA
jgi:hypothetical protein